MQKAGMTDKAIIDTFVKEYGPDSYRGDPSSFYWIVPYAVLALGALAMFWFVRRYYHPPRPVTASGPEDEGLSRYRDAIEKDMAKLE
jgi:cytochrome c-type biogenesis protein CcmH/NrfF